MVIFHSYVSLPEGNYIVFFMFIAVYCHYDFVDVGFTQCRIEPPITEGLRNPCLLRTGNGLS